MTDVELRCPLPGGPNELLGKLTHHDEPSSGNVWLKCSYCTRMRKKRSISNVRVIHGFLTSSGSYHDSKTEDQR